MKLNAIACAVMFALAAPALASDAATDTAQPAPEKPKKICRAVVNTGSIMPKRICMTADLWKQIDAKRNEDSENAMARKGSISGSTDSN